MEKFIVLFCEYCIIPLFLWATIFFIKVFESIKEKGINQEKVTDYGFEFILLESLAHFTVFLRINFDECKTYTGIIPLSLLSLISSILLFLYFLNQVIATKSLKFKKVTTYREVLHIFYWSLVMRSFLLFVFAETEIFYTDQMCHKIAALAIIVFLFYLIFITIYAPLVDIYFITWHRAASEKTTLLKNGEFRKVRRIANWQSKIKYFRKNEENFVAFIESVRSYAEASLADGKLTSESINKIENLLSKSHLREHIDKQMFTKLLDSLKSKG